MTSRSHRWGPFSALFLRLWYFESFFDPIPHPPPIFLSPQHPKTISSPFSRLLSLFRLSPHHLLLRSSLNIFTIMYNRLFLSVTHPRVASSRKSFFLDDSRSKMIDHTTCPVVCPHVQCNLTRSWSTTEARSTTQTAIVSHVTQDPTWFRSSTRLKKGNAADQRSREK